MANIIQKILDDKQEYRAQMAKVAALPDDYQFVYKKMQSYMWGLAGGDGFDMLRTQYALIQLFEESAAQGLHVLDVTGQDVAGFCDELIRDNNLWTNRPRRKLNRDMEKHLKKESDTK